MVVEVPTMRPPAPPRRQPNRAAAHGAGSWVQSSRGWWHRSAAPRCRAQISARPWPVVLAGRACASCQGAPAYRPIVARAGGEVERKAPYHPTDPFLLLDDFRNDVPADYLARFPWHPHRGIETITYVLAGTVEHGDSMGNRGAIAAGDVQWMTAGRGIIHQEM